MLQVWQGWSLHKHCPLNQDQNSQDHHSQYYHKGGYSATLAKAVNNLSLLLKEHTKIT